MGEHTVTVTTATFDETIASETAVLVDFWAEWCGPCRAIAPALDAIAADNAGSLVVAKLNVDENPDVASGLGIMGIPTMIVFKDGVEKKRMVGARTKQAIEKELAEFI